ncbi:hypothetical protein P154DRAFT_570298 [Amniculicola lignicola CBS 123094]|uniref:F-box domain-containing protein n=1 Tax=Amniculicola lignicola CBS 123094 TaxID=1392246 RepID=A0A6A5WWZ6_9PLEO|nr:hypothetical protein P154DRAFT_570298 [Amniculicola lignicola CBS 123094]
MPDLHNLPVELVSSICGNLDDSDVRSLRQVNHRLAENTVNVFARQFESINVSCTYEGLVCLEELAGPASVKNIRFRSITVSCTTGGLKRLEELAKDSAAAGRVEKITIQAPFDNSNIENMINSWLDEEYPTYEALEASSTINLNQLWLQGHMEVRNTLVESLKRFPKLKAMKITSQPLPSFGWCRVKLPWHYKSHVFGVVLYVIPALEKPTLEVELAIYCWGSQDVAVRPFSLRAQGQNEETQRLMFGICRLDLQPILRQYVQHLEFHYIDRPTKNWFFELLDIFSGEKSHLRTLRLIDFCQYQGELQTLGDANIHFPYLTDLELRGNMSIDFRMTQFLQNHGSMLRSIILKDAYEDTGGVWREMFTSLAQMPALDRLVLSNLGGYVDPLWCSRPHPLHTTEWNGNNTIVVRSLAMAASAQLSNFMRRGIDIGQIDLNEILTAEG